MSALVWSAILLPVGLVWSAFMLWAMCSDEDRFQEELGRLREERERERRISTLLDKSTTTPHR